MATLYANYSFDYRTINMHLLSSHQTDFQFHDNINEFYHGKTYEDIVAIEYYVGGTYYAAYFGGKNVEFNSGQTEVQSGTATGFLNEIWNGSAWVPWWGVEGFSYSAKALSDAVSTVSRTDDYRIVADILDGNDSLNMSNGADVIRGYAGNDTIRGNQGNDALFGDAGADTIQGGAGSDRLSGGEGNDRFVGGMDKDYLTGDAGADVFDFNSTAEAGNGTARDTIKDFAHLTDRIDLQNIDANTATSGNQSFTFFKGAAFSGSFAAPGRLYYDTSTGILWGNNDADADADFSILIFNKAALTGSDFVL